MTLNGETTEYTIVVIGDLNGDGKMTDGDLMRLARYLVKLDRNLKGAYLRATDVHPDKKLARDSDLMKMARILVKLATLD